jgi:hypothetical protein
MVRWKVFLPCGQGWQYETAKVLMMVMEFCETLNEDYQL